MSLSLLSLGFLIGMRHALEADHLAAVATLVRPQAKLRDAVRHGGAWGLGHTATLLLFGSAVILLDTSMPDRLAHGLEFAVGVMLIVLGLNVLRRLRADRIHFHEHTHPGVEVRHFHAHSHRGDLGRHDPAEHRHRHQDPAPWRSLAVGLMHGMAGSAALILLTVDQIDSAWTGALYMLLFGLGSMVGMVALSLVIALPLHYTARRLTWLHNGLQMSVAMFSGGLGAYICWGLAGTF